MAEDTPLETEETEETTENTEDTLLTSEESSEETTESKSEESDSTADDDTSKDEEKDGKKEEDEKVVPDEYKFEMPEGFELDADKAAKFTDVAKEVKLSQEEADKLVGLFTEAQVEAIKAQQEAWANQLVEWKEAATKDEQFGGAKFQENLGFAKKALDVFGNEALREVLNQSGMGNHPEVIRMLVNIGKAASDDTFVFGKSGQGQPEPAEKLLFPNQN